MFPLTYDLGPQSLRKNRTLYKELGSIQELATVWRVALLSAQLLSPSTLIKSAPIQPLEFLGVTGETG